MSKKVKVCLALFLSFAVLAQYSFTPQAMVAYGLNGDADTVAASSSEQPEQEATNPAPEPSHATEAPAPTQAPAATTESTQATESTEATTVPEEQSDDVEDENDVNTGDPIAGEDPAAEEEEAAEEDTDEEWERSFSGSCNGLTVKVSAPEGAFKKGTEMNLSAISDATAASIVSSVLPEDKEVADVVGVDISFSYKGSKDQPNESVKVSISGANLEGSNPVLYHKHGGAVEQSGASNNGATLTTGAFSPFIIATSVEGEEETNRVTFYDRDADVYATVDVPKGEAIGNQLPAPIEREDYNPYWVIGKIVQGEQGTEFVKTGARIDKDFIPKEDTTVGPDYDLVSYKVTFYQEDKTTVVGERTVTADTNYCVNDIPIVPAKDGHVGKWVYSEGDFDNSVKITEDTAVWADYSQNVFTVKFMVEGDEYVTDTYYSGDTLSLPSEPVVEGKEFSGWFVGETEYKGGETVTSNLTITAAFENEYTVTFIVKHDDQTEERLSQFFRTTGEEIGTVPEPPFEAGKVFEKWVNQETGDEVTAATIVEGNITAVAKFHEVKVYNLTSEYYYVNDDGEEVVFNTDLMQVEGHELPYTITAPSTTQTDPNQVSGGPVYYPETPTVTVKEENFDSDNKYTVRIKYVPYTAEYDYVYVLKDLEGDGYTEIPDSKEHVYGVLNSYVTPTVKDFDNCVLEIAEGQTITEASGQELFVKYKRKNVQLTYETNGGSYVAGTTAPYGSTVELPSKNPTKDGYDFEGWYTDEELTNKVTDSVTLEGDTTLYAKWTGKEVDYTIVYMFEKYNDAGTESSFVYDNSATGHGVVGETVYANDSSIPGKTVTGWEKDTAKNAQSSVVIAADGSSVLFVYYKLTEYTFHFRPGTFSYGYNNYNVTAPLNGESRTGNNNWSYSFTAKLGQDISSKWISAGNGTVRINGWNYNVNFSGWIPPGSSTVYVTKRLTLTEDMLPSSGTNITYSGYWLYSTVTYTVNYMLQNADNDEYTRSTEYSQTYNYSSDATISPKDIPGYTYASRTDRGNTTTFYYNRDKFKIDYFHGSTQLKSISNIKFDATITSNTYNWTPTAEECGVDSDYTFDGWYSDSGLTTKYTFNKMPASNLVLYAKWKAPSYTVSFVDGDEPDTKLAKDQTVEKYKKAEKPQNPTKDGYVFDGWYSTADGNTLYDWNNQITSNTTVYAHWVRATLGYTVHYVDEEGNSVAPDKKVTNPNFVIGQEITEQAIAVAGYRPQTNSETLTLAAEDNEINFIYSKKVESTTYTVKYILDPEEYPGDEIEVAETKTVDNVPGDTSSVVEMAKAVDYSMLSGYEELKGVEFYPDEVEKTLVLTTNPKENVLVFKYSSYKHVTVTVNYVDMDGETIAGQNVEYLKVGKTFTLSRTPIAGWELNKAVEGESYGGSEAGSSYKITNKLAESGTLEFTLFYQKKVTITANSDSKQYDGEALTLPGLPKDNVTVEGLPEGEALNKLSFTFTNTDNTTNDGRINAGVATVTPTGAGTDGTHQSSNYYVFRYISGTLEVTKVNVTVRIEPDRWTGAVYRGTPYMTGFTNPSKGIGDYIKISHDGYKAKYLNTIWGLVTDLDNVKYASSAVGLKYYVLDEKDAGDYSYNLNLQSSDMPNGDGNYSVSLYVRPGRLQILPREATVTTGSASKTYDGTPLTNGVANITGLVASDEGKVTVTATGSQTEVGSSENSCSINWGEVKPENYTITKKLGTLTVKPIMTIKVTGNNKTTKYNGAPQTLEGYTVTSDIPGFDKSKVVYSGEAVASGTDAGTYKMGLSAEHFSYNDESVTASFEVADGTLTIAPRNVTITSASATKVYDGTALTNNGITISGDGFVAGETPAFRVTGSQTAVGSSKNTFDILPNNVQSSAVLDLVTASANGYLASNYNIDKVYGTLTVTQAATPTPTPVPDNDGNNPGGGNPAVAAVNPIPAATIDDTPAPTTINDEPAPRAAAGFWALINLICAILTALLSLIMLIRYFGKRREEDEETGEVTEIKRRGGVKLASIIPAIGAIIAFILTEDMTLPMQMVDKWTVLMVVILAIQALVVFFSRKKEEEEDQEDEGAMA